LSELQFFVEHLLTRLLVECCVCISPASTSHARSADLFVSSSIMGPVIGGFLADPLRNHPEWFHGSRPAFFEKFPFALPNIVCGLVFLFSVPTGILFLDVSNIIEGLPHVLHLLTMLP